MLVTSGTRASAEVLARRLPAGVHPPVRAGRHARRGAPLPAATGGRTSALFVESELWPNLILAARGAGVAAGPGLGADDREERHGAGRARPAAARRDAGELRPDPGAGRGDRARGWRRSAARIGGRLNLKRVGEPLPCDAGGAGAPAGDDRRAAGRAWRPAPTAGEEALIARRGAPRSAATPLPIIVPRHPERGDDDRRRPGALAAGPALGRRGDRAGHRRLSRRHPGRDRACSCGWPTSR